MHPGWSHMDVWTPPSISTRSFFSPFQATYRSGLSPFSRLTPPRRSTTVDKTQFWPSNSPEDSDDDVSTQPSGSTPTSFRIPITFHTDEEDRSTRATPARVRPSPTSPPATQKYPFIDVNNKRDYRGEVPKYGLSPPNYASDSTTKSAPAKRAYYETTGPSTAMPIPTSPPPLREVYNRQSSAYNDNRQPHNLDFYADARNRGRGEEPSHAYSPTNDRMTFMQPPPAPPNSYSSPVRNRPKNFPHDFADHLDGHELDPSALQKETDAYDAMELNPADFPDTPPPEHISAKEFLQQRLKLYGFKIKSNIPGDGNCLFASIADELFDNQDYHKKVREAVVGWLRKNPNFQLPNSTKLIDFLETDRFGTWDGYCDYMAQDGKWGDHLTLIAASELFRTQIVIISSVTVKDGLDPFTVITPTKQAPGRVCYLGHLHEFHYNSLEPDDECEPVAIRTLYIQDDEVVNVERYIEIIFSMNGSQFIEKYIEAYLEPYRGPQNARHTNRLWWVTECCEYGNIKEILEKMDRGLSEFEVQCILPSVLEALLYLHSTRFVYLELKCKAILIDSNFQIKLLNPGFVRVNGSVYYMGPQGPFPDSPSVYWMSPERIKESENSLPSDVWTLGITVIEMVDGQPPWRDIQPLRALFVIPSNPSPTLKNPLERSEAINDFVSKCLDKIPKNRATVRELLQHPFLPTASSSKERIRRECISRLVNDARQYKSKGRE